MITSIKSISNNRVNYQLHSNNVRGKYDTALLDIVRGEGPKTKYPSDIAILDKYIE